MTADLSNEALDLIALNEGIMHAEIIGSAKVQMDTADARAMHDAITARRAEIEALRTQNAELKSLVDAAFRDQAMKNIYYAELAHRVKKLESEAEAEAEAALAAQTGPVAIEIATIAERDMWRERTQKAETALAAVADAMNDLLGEARGIVPKSADAFYDGQRGEFTSARILAAIEPNPAAQDRDALIAETWERAAQIAGDAFWSAPVPKFWDRDKMEYADWCDWQSKRAQKVIRALAAQPQTDALEAVRLEARAEGMRKAAELFNGSDLWEEAGIRQWILAAADSEGKTDGA